MDEKTEARYRDECRKIITTLSGKTNRLSPRYSQIDEVFSNYEVFKKHIHNNMNYNDVPSKTEPLMDSHKIASAFFCSFLKAKPIKYTPDSSNNPPSGFELQANEWGAFIFGLQVVMDFWADKVFDSVTAEDQEIYKQPIRFPETSKDNYVTWFIKLVTDGIEKYFDFDNEKYEGKFIFFIAHIYFMIEKYAYQYHKTCLYEKRSIHLAQELAATKKTP